MNEWERNRRLAEPTRKAYPPGTRILLNHMDDPRDPVRAGMRGTVRFVDDQSQIHIQWDNGRGLALIPGVDSFRKLTQEELVQECVPLQKGIFCIVEEDGCFEGYTTGKTWNGWVQPLFEKDTAEKVCAKYLGGQQAKTVYDRERNSFVVDDHELGMAYEYAAYELGRMYKDGVGTTADKAASESWYRKAYLGFLSIERQMADDKLYYRLGQMNLTGTGTEKDLDLAREYFEKAAALDNADALYGLGKLYLDPRFAGCSAPRAVDYLFAAAQKGHDYGQYALGRLFLAGEVVPKNPAYALIWLEKAVKQENPAAEYLLGKALLLGEDAPQDLARGEALLNRAIENGHEYAAYVLGKAYLEGSAVAQDIPKAIGYLTMAAEKGAAPAEYALGKLFYQGEVVPKDVGKALYHLESAAEKDHPYAAYLAGKIRLSEEGYLDVEKAVRLFEAAAALGNDFAEYQLGKLYLYGKDVSQ